MFVHLRQLSSGMDTQANGKDINRFGSTVGRGEWYRAFDAGFDPDDATEFQIALVGNANQRQRETVEWMTGIDDRHRFLGC